MNGIVNGYILYADDLQRQDYLFRVSLKAVIFNENDEILIVKESGRDWWDIPGGRIDHGESIKEALARELREEVSLTGDFTYTTILAEDPRYLSSHNLYQMRLTFLVENYDSNNFAPGDDGDEILFVNPIRFKDSDVITEQKIYEYSQLALANRSRPRSEARLSR